MRQTTRPTQFSCISPPKSVFWALVFASSSVVVGCSSTSPASGNGNNSVGGTNSGGGSATSPKGGAPGAGGTTGAGGQSASSVGNPTGGTSVVTAAGGQSATGGAGVGGSAAGGKSAAGGAPSGGVSAGGTPASGGANAGGAPAGGAVTGGTQATGGSSSVAGGASNSSNGGTASGGKAGGSSSTLGGASPTGGTTSTSTNGTGPCDIYEAASKPCVAAYSSTRVLYSKYSGNLYQLRKGGGSKNTGTGGTTQDIGIKDGFPDTAAHEAFCGTDSCTFSILYDQSGKKNDLKVAPAGCYDDGSANTPDYESNAKQRSLTVGGHKVYALYMLAHEGYRNNKPTGMTTTADQGIYWLVDGKRYGDACCWDFGNASVDNCNKGVMNAIFFGIGYWGSGAGNGPWFMGDFEGGVWAGGSGDSKTTNNSNPTITYDFAFGILKSGPGNYAIRVANGQSGSLTTAYDGKSPKELKAPGGIILGIGGDNSNHSFGTFFEGVMTASRPDDATDAAVLKNVQDAGYVK